MPRASNHLYSFGVICRSQPCLSSDMGMPTDLIACQFCFRCTLCSADPCPLRVEQAS
jgi:hypothetical protein